MVTIKLKNINKVRSKGHTYYYMGRGAGAIRLEGEPGTPEFLASYEAARAPQVQIDRRKFKAWVTLYRANEFPRLAETTQRTWLPWLDEVQKHFGDLSLRQFDRPQIRHDIKAWRDNWRDKPRAADFAKQVLSRVLSYAVEDGQLLTNPCNAIPNLYENDRADIIWTDHDLARLLAVAAPEIGWAAQLAKYTGLRQGDLLRLTWNNISDNHIEIATSKSRKKRHALIPMHAPLRALLRAIPKRATVVLTNSRGLPWRGFGSSWNKAMKEAGLDGQDLHFHDFRGTFCTVIYGALTSR